MKSKNLVSSFSYHLDQIEIMNQLEIIAERENKKVSQIIMQLIEDYVKNHAEGNSTFRLENWVENPQFHAIPTIFAKNETWLKHFREMKVSERADTLKQINVLRKFCVTSGPLK